MYLILTIDTFAKYFQLSILFTTLYLYILKTARILIFKLGTISLQLAEGPINKLTKSREYY